MNVACRQSRTIGVRSWLVSDGFRGAGFVLDPRDRLRGGPGRPCRGAAAAGPDPAVDGPGPGGCVRSLRRRVRRGTGDAGLPRGVQGRSRPLWLARHPLLQPVLREACSGAGNPRPGPVPPTWTSRTGWRASCCSSTAKWTTKSTRTTRCDWPTGSSPPTRTSSCSSCPGPSTRSRDLGPWPVGRTVLARYGRLVQLGLWVDRARRWHGIGGE